MNNKYIKLRELFSKLIHIEAILRESDWGLVSHNVKERHLKEKEEIDNQIKALLG